MFPIKNTGVVNNKLEYILVINMFFAFKGKDFSILIFLPSRLITELVIDVIYDAAETSPKINTDKLLIISFLDMLNPTLK